MADVELPDLSRYDRAGIDTETTGVTWQDRPVGLSYATPDGKKGYLAWGHEGGNNCSIEEVRTWAKEQLVPGRLKKIFFNGAFDIRMLAYDTPGNHGVEGLGVLLQENIEDGLVVVPVLNEMEEKFSLDALLKKYCDSEKKDDYLNDWCAAQFGGKATRQAQGGNYWRVPWGVIDEYAQWDAAGTLELFDRRRPCIDSEGLSAIYAVETALIPLLVRMHLTGVRVDLERAQLAKVAFERRKEIAGARWEELAPGVNPLSTDQLVAVFERYGLPYGRTKNKSKDPLGNPSITKEVLDNLPDDSEVGALIQELREVSKMGGTYVENYILGYADALAAVHGQFHQLPNDLYGTVSGRFSSSEPNLQNLPGDRHPELMRIIRGLFVPYLPGQTWYKADSSQIEYRFLAHYAGGKLRAQYNLTPDIDFHQMLTDMINMPDVCNRRRTKNVNFAIVYGAGIPKAAATAGVSVEVMTEVFKIYHEATEGQIKDLSKKAQQRAKDRGYIITWGGRKRHFMDAAKARAKGWKVYRGERYVGTHAALNALLQGSAADLMKKQLVAAAPLIDWQNTHLHMTVHDELDISGPHPASADGQRFARDLKEALEGRSPRPEHQFHLTVPTMVELSAGPNWGAVEKLKLTA